MGSGLPSSPSNDGWTCAALPLCYFGCLAFSVFAKLSERKGFWGGEYAELKGSLQLLTSSQLRERDKMLLRAILCGVFGTDSFQARPRKKTFLVDFVVTGMEMATYSGSVLFTAFSMLGIFLSLLLNRSNWPRCLLWHGWLPGLSGLCDKDPWASSFGDLAFSNLERCLGAHPVDHSGFWTPPDYWDADDVALEMSDHPNIWTDGSREDFSSVGGFEVAGAGVYLPPSEVAFDSSVYGTSEEYGDARLERCRAFLPVLGVIQTVQRAEFLVLFLPCRRLGLVISGIDNIPDYWDAADIALEMPEHPNVWTDVRWL